MADRFGREISKSVNEDGTYTYQVPGISVIAESDERALETLNAMAPEGWVEPSDQH